MSSQPAQSQRAQVSVVIAVRHERVRAALWTLLEADPDVEPLAATADAEDLMTLLARIRPAAVVIDDALLARTGVVPGTAFVAVGMQDHPGYAARAREAGAGDYVPLDEADRLGRAVIEAIEPSVPFGAARRRTGRRAVTVVPAPGADSTASRLPSSSTRSRIPISPKPSERSEGSKP